MLNPKTINRRHGYLTVLALLALLAGPGVLSASAAALKLASYFGDHMVLQRDHPLVIQGTGDPGAMVQVAFASQTASTTVGTNQTWSVQLASVSAGGPYTLTATSGSQAVTLTDVLSGDVWLCSGQSNMQMPVKECDAAEQQATVATLPNLRLCTVGKGWNAQPQSSADIHWRTCTPDTARNFSAIGYFFAASLQRDPALASVPIGVIDSSFGGTTCEGWIPNDSLIAFNPKDLHESMFGIKPGMLYNAMIAPLGQAPLKGVVWYQGESNSGHPDTYPQFLSTMIRDWRRQFAMPDLPFLIVQLPDYAYQWDGFYWPWLREAQAKVVSATPHTSLVLGINTTDGFNLHPHQKLEIGRRAALLARRDAYGESLVANGPFFQSAKINGSSVTVAFDSADGLSNAVPGGVQGFLLAGTNGIYYIADARIDGSTVILTSDQVPQPATVRYAWAGVPDSSLVNQTGLPAAPFRTDDFPDANVEVQKESVSHHVTTSAYEVSVNGDGKVTSLIVHGAQFLSNEPGSAGGSSIPGAFGPRALSTIQSLGPDFLACSDLDVTLVLKFHEDAMEWTLTNRSKDAAGFSLALGPAVSITPGVRPGDFQLKHKSTSFNLTGFDKAGDSDNGKVLELTVPGSATRQINFDFTTR
jgi:sialate O-acetylesterase